MAQLTPREQLDQLLDWLLVIAVGEVEPNIEALNRILADMPLVRHGYMKPLGVLEFGPTRSRYVKDGIVVALIPGGASDASRKDFIGHVADEHRKNQGGSFRTIRPYEYELNANTGTAQLTRRADVGYAEVMSRSYGYQVAVVTDRQSLLSFLATVDDLTQVRIADNGITLGGRKVLGRKYRGIGIEHIGTIWQAQSKINVIRREWKSYEDQQVSLFNAKWSRRTYKNEWERTRLKSESDAEWAELEKQLAAEYRRRKIMDHTGFSLDPDYDYPSLSSELVRVGLDAQRDRHGILAGLAQRNIVPLLRLEDSLSKDTDKGAELAAYLALLRRQHEYQAARYDGDLGGTEVGMILYYTDLLAKLWVLDYRDSAPASEVPGFLSGLTAPVSIAYKTELELFPSARLWFGTSNLGFQVSSSREILFRRNSTRIYSAGSNPLEPGKEVQTSVALGAPIDWWNDHYEEVEWVEPEYQRLNQIMKWSIALSWIQDQPNAKVLDFLSDETVRRDYWFPEWVRRQPNLRFKEWDTVGFLPKGAKGSKTEALPRLLSRNFSRFDGPPQHTISGGVSLARSSEIKARPPVPADFLQSVRRSNVNYTKSRGRDGVTTLDGVTYSFSASGKTAGTTIKASPDAKLRGTFAQVRNAPFQRDIVSGTDGIAMALRLDGHPIGQLGIRPAGNGFRVVWKAEDMEAGTALARKLSKEPDIPAALKTNAEVEAAYALRDNGQYIVKLTGSRRWNLLAVEDKPAPTLSAKAHARAGEVNTGVSIEVAAIESGQARQMAAGARPIKTETTDNVSGRQFSDAANSLSGMRGEAARKVMSERLTRDLAIVDDLIRQGNQPRAIARIDELIDFYGRTPELSLKKAVLLLERRQVELAGEATKGMTPVPMRGPKSFFDEINGRFRQSNSAIERHNLETMSDIAALHHRTTSSVRDLGETPQVLPFSNKGRLEIGYQVEKGKKAVEVPPNDLARVDRNAVVYVEDSAAFSNVDWSVPLQQSMARPVSGAKVLKYTDQNLDLYRPVKVFSADGQRSYRRAREGTRADIAARQAGAQGARPANQTDSSSGCSEPTNPAQREVCAQSGLPRGREVYVIVQDSAGL